MYERAVLSSYVVSLFSLMFWPVFSMNPCQITDQHFTEIHQKYQCVSERV